MHTAPQNQGFSLVGVLVAMALIGTIAVAVSQLYTNQSAESRIVEDRQSREAVRRFLRLTVSCSDTVAANSSCTPDKGAKILFKGNSSVVINGEGVVANKGNEMFGPYALRAFCGKTASTYRFEIKRGNAAWKDLFDVPFTCI